MSVPSAAKRNWFDRYMEGLKSLAEAAPDDYTTTDEIPLVGGLLPEQVRGLPVAPSPLQTLKPLGTESALMNIADASTLKPLIQGPLLAGFGANMRLLDQLPNISGDPQENQRVPFTDKPRIPFEGSDFDPANYADYAHRNLQESLLGSIAEGTLHPTSWIGGPAKGVGRGLAAFAAKEGANIPRLERAGQLIAKGDMAYDEALHGGVGALKQTSGAAGQQINRIPVVGRATRFLASPSVLALEGDYGQQIGGAMARANNALKGKGSTLEQELKTGSTIPRILPKDKVAAWKIVKASKDRINVELNALAPEHQPHALRLLGDLIDMDNAVQTQMTIERGMLSERWEQLRTTFTNATDLADARDEMDEKIADLFDRQANAQHRNNLGMLQAIDAIKRMPIGTPMDPARAALVKQATQQAVLEAAEASKEARRYAAELRGKPIYDAKTRTVTRRQPIWHEDRWYENRDAIKGEDPAYRDARARAMKAVDDAVNVLGESVDHPTMREGRRLFDDHRSLLEDFNGNPLAAINAAGVPADVIATISREVVNPRQFMTRAMDEVTANRDMVRRRAEAAIRADLVKKGATKADIDKAMPSILKEARIALAHPTFHQAKPGLAGRLGQKEFTPLGEQLSRIAKRYDQHGDLFNPDDTLQIWGGRMQEMFRAEELGVKPMRRGIVVPGIGMTAVDQLQRLPGMGGAAKQLDQEWLQEAVGKLNDHFQDQGMTPQAAGAEATRLAKDPAALLRHPAMVALLKDDLKTAAGLTIGSWKEQNLLAPAYHVANFASQVLMGKDAPSFGGTAVEPKFLMKLLKKNADTLFREGRVDHTIDARIAPEFVSVLGDKVPPDWLGNIGEQASIPGAETMSATARIPVGIRLALMGGGAAYAGERTGELAGLSDEDKAKLAGVGGLLGGLYAWKVPSLVKGNFLVAGTMESAARKAAGITAAEEALGAINLDAATGAVTGTGFRKGYYDAMRDMMDVNDIQSFGQRVEGPVPLGERPATPGPTQPPVPDPNAPIEMPPGAAAPTAGGLKPYRLPSGEAAPGAYQAASEANTLAMDHPDVVALERQERALDAQSQALAQRLGTLDSDEISALTNQRNAIVKQKIALRNRIIGEAMNERGFLSLEQEEALAATSAAPAAPPLIQDSFMPTVKARAPLPTEPRPVAATHQRDTIYPTPGVQKRRWTLFNGQPVDDGAGWKIHLSVTPENYDKVIAYLRRVTAYSGSMPQDYAGNLPRVVPELASKEKGIQWKHLSGGSHEDGKDFTLYVGHRDDAEDLAAKITKDIGDVLTDPSTLPPYEEGFRPSVQNDDIQVGKTSMRFENTYDLKNLPVEFDQYGARGIPYIRTDRDAFIFNRMAAKHGSSVEFDYKGMRDRAHDYLDAYYGEFYTGTRGNPIDDLGTGARKVEPAAAAGPPTYQAAQAAMDAFDNQMAAKYGADAVQNWNDYTPEEIAEAERLLQARDAIGEAGDTEAAVLAGMQARALAREATVPPRPEQPPFTGVPANLPAGANPRARGIPADTPVDPSSIEAITAGGNARAQALDQAAQDHDRALAAWQNATTKSQALNNQLKRLMRVRAADRNTDGIAIVNEQLAASRAEETAAYDAWIAASGRQKRLEQGLSAEEPAAPIVMPAERPAADAVSMPVPDPVGPSTVDDQRPWAWQVPRQQFIDRPSQTPMQFIEGATYLQGDEHMRMLTNVRNRAYERIPESLRRLANNPDYPISKPPSKANQKLIDAYRQAQNDIFEYEGQMNLKHQTQLHRQQVIAALDNGEPVPAEVLADYPDLMGMAQARQPIVSLDEGGPIIPEPVQPPIEPEPLPDGMPLDAEDYPDATPPIEEPPIEALPPGGGGQPPRPPNEPPGPPSAEPPMDPWLDPSLFEVPYGEQLDTLFEIAVERARLRNAANPASRERLAALAVEADQLQSSMQYQNKLVPDWVDNAEFEAQLGGALEGGLNGQKRNYEQIKQEAINFVASRFKPYEADLFSPNANPQQIVNLLRDQIPFTTRGEFIDDIETFARDKLRLDLEIPDTFRERLKTLEAVQANVNRKLNWLPDTPVDGRPEMVDLLSMTPSQVEDWTKYLGADDATLINTTRVIYEQTDDALYVMLRRAVEDAQAKAGGVGLGGGGLGGGGNLPPLPPAPGAWTWDAPSPNFKIGELRTSRAVNRSRGLALGDIGNAPAPMELGDYYRLGQQGPRIKLGSRGDIDAIQRHFAEKNGRLTPNEVYTMATSYGATPQQAARLRAGWDDFAWKAREAGRENANNIHIDYQDISNLIYYGKMGPMPFLTWQAKAIPKYLQMLAHHPGLIVALNEYNKASEREIEEAGLPASFRNFTQQGGMIDALAGNAFGREGNVYANPLPVVFPYSDVGREASDYASPTDQVLGAMQSVGLGPSPLVTMPLYMAGLTSDMPINTLRTSPMLAGISQLATGHAIDPELGLKQATRAVRERVAPGETQPTVTGDPIRDYYIRKRIASVAVERTGKPPAGEYLKAIQDGTGPIWANAQRDIEREMTGRTAISALAPVRTRLVDTGEQQIRQAQVEEGITSAALEELDRQPLTRKDLQYAAASLARDPLDREETLEERAKGLRIARRFGEARASAPETGGLSGLGADPRSQARRALLLERESRRVRPLSASARASRDRAELLRGEQVLRQMGA